jgi:hypothetical protein
MAKEGKGCANTKKGCIRKKGKIFKILNNKRGGWWTKKQGGGIFKTREAAVKKLGAIHANK